MRNKKFIGLLLAIAVVKASATVNIVAAENFYGELAKEIGGTSVNVQSIISNPNADPHLFTTSAKTSKDINHADIIIYNGANYDDWIKPMLLSSKNKNTIIINVADLVHVKDGANPHIWYKSETFAVLAKQIATVLKKQNPHDSKLININLKKFLAENKKVFIEVDQIKKSCHGVKVTATEPVFGYMASNMGLDMQGLDFQWKIMNNTEPSPQMVASFEDLLNKKQVKVLFYNSQVTDSITTNMKELAQKNHIPIVGVTETMPLNMSINAWLKQEVFLTTTTLKNSCMK
jgi:zinc/manganese transport system substrate-binding protein